MERESKTSGGSHAPPTILKKRKRDSNDGETEAETRSPRSKRVKVEYENHVLKYPGRIPSPMRLARAEMGHLRHQWLVLWSRYHDMKGPIEKAREIVFSELSTLLRIRNIAIVQLSHERVDEEMQSLCVEAVNTRKMAIKYREDEMLRLNDLLEIHDLSAELAANAIRELEQNIRLHDEATERGSEPEFFPMTSLTMVDGILYRDVPKPLEDCTQISGAFTSFKCLPSEIRQLIWQYALPGPRVLTHSGEHNKKLSLLSVCRESRDVVGKKYERLIRFSFEFDLKKANPVLYTNLDIDTLVVDLTLPQTAESGPDIRNRSLFDLPHADFNKTILRYLTGLSGLKHLALGFNVAEENGGTFFTCLQASCPNLNTLTVFPNSQLHVSTRNQLKFLEKYDLHLIEVDSNLTDFEYFRHTILSNRGCKHSAFRGLEILDHLEDVAHQYIRDFPEHVGKYCRRFGLDWNPTSRLCLLASWNERYNGFQPLHLEGDDYWKGYPGVYGELYEGFIESGVVCDAEGEIFNRYEGIQRLFEEDH